MIEIKNNNKPYFYKNISGNVQTNRLDSKLIYSNFLKLNKYIDFEVTALWDSGGYYVTETIIKHGIAGQIPIINIFVQNGLNNTQVGDKTTLVANAETNDTDFIVRIANFSTSEKYYQLRAFVYTIIDR